MRADLTVPEQVMTAVDDAVARFGPTKVLIHNAAELVIGRFAELADADFETTWRSITLSAVYFAQATLWRMVAAGFRRDRESAGRRQLRSL